MNIKELTLEAFEEWAIAYDLHFYINNYEGKISATFYYDKWMIIANFQKHRFVCSNLKWEYNPHDNPPLFVFDKWDDVMKLVDFQF